MAEPLGIVSSVIGGISLVSGAVSRVMATSESLKIVESFEQRSKFKAEIVEIAILDSLVFEVRAALYEPGQVSGRVSGPIVMVESSCNESQEQVHHLLATMNKSSRLPESKSRGTTRSRKGNFATELNALVEVYRKYAFLLRDLCAEQVPRSYPISQLHVLTSNA